VDHRALARSENFSVFFGRELGSSGVALAAEALPARIQGSVAKLIMPGRRATAEPALGVGRLKKTMRESQKRKY
jgi:hypothetical protein